MFHPCLLARVMIRNTLRTPAIIVGYLNAIIDTILSSVYGTMQGLQDIVLTTDLSSYICGKMLASLIESCDRMHTQLHC